MSDSSNPGAQPIDGRAAGARAADVTPSDATAIDVEAPTPRDAAPPAEPRVSAAARLAAHPKVKQAISLAKEHPLGAVATVAAAAALVEVQFAVGVLTGLGATALLAKKSGPQARDEVIARGRQAIARARVAMAKRKNASTAPSVEAPPPAAE